MREEYTSRSHSYSKDMPKSFNKLMKAYYFLSKHPKFEVEFPTDGSKPPPKHPNSIKKSTIPESLQDEVFNDESNTFVRAPSRKDRPSGREVSKHAYAINLIVDKVTEKTAAMHGNSLFLQDIWLKIESAIEVTSRHMKTNVENQNGKRSVSHEKVLF